MFSDGIRPGGDLTELDGSAEPRLPLRKSGRSSKRLMDRTPTPGEGNYHLPAKPLHNSDTDSVHFNQFYWMGICDKVRRHL